MNKGRYEVSSDFTVFRQRDRAPKHLKAGLQLSAYEPIQDPVISEIDTERYESDKSGFVAHTAPIDRS